MVGFTVRLCSKKLKMAWTGKDAHWTGKAAKWTGKDAHFFSTILYHPADKSQVRIHCPSFKDWLEETPSTLRELPNLYYLVGTPQHAPVQRRATGHPRPSQRRFA